MTERGNPFRIVRDVTTAPATSAWAMKAQALLRFTVKYVSASPRAIEAEIRGIWRAIMWLQGYINARNYSDMRDGKPTNAKAHHEIVKERRVIAGAWTLAVIVATLWIKAKFGIPGIGLLVLCASLGFAYWGKDIRIVDPLTGAGIGLSETGIQAAVAVAVMNVNLERFPDAWRQVKIVKGLRQDGETMKITLALPGAFPGTMARTRRDKLASALELTTSQLIVDPDPARRNTSEIELTIHPGEPWNKASTVSPIAESPRQMCVWDELPFAEDLNGRPVNVSLPYKSMLLGGLPDMGKTTAAINVLAACALDPWVRLWTLDAKGVDFPAVAPMCWRYVGNSQDDAIAMLNELYRVGDAKMARLRELNQQKLTRAIQEQEIASETLSELCFVDVLYADELRFYTAGDDPAKSREIVSLMSRIVEIFRAAGIIVLCATQRPHSQVVDTSLRDLIRIRCALATTTWQTSNTILGDTAYKMGFSATEFDAEEKGVMWYREVKKFVQCRAYWISQEQFNRICRYAFDLRNSAGTLPKQIEGSLVPEAPEFLAKLRSVIMAEGQGRMPTRDILLAPEFEGFTADSLGKEARRHHLQSNEVGPWGDRARVRGYRLDDIAAAVAKCAKDPEFRKGVRGVVS